MSVRRPGGATGHQPFTLRVLLATDESDRGEPLAALLECLGYSVEEIADGRRALDRLLQPDAPRIALVAWNLAGLDGLGLTRELRQATRQGPTGSRFLFLLAERSGGRNLTAAIEAGADDCLVRPLDPDELDVRLRLARRVLTLEQQLAATRGALGQQAMREPETGLWNRRAVLELLDLEVSRSRRSNDPLGTVLVSVDGLRSAFESHGDRAGEQVVEEVARRLRTSLRTSDAVGRLSDEEFLLVLPGCNLERSVGTAHRLLRALRQRPVETNGGALEVTACFGVASSRRDERDGEQLLAEASNALRRARAAGAGSIARA